MYASSDRIVKYIESVYDMFSRVFDSLKNNKTS